MIHRRHADDAGGEVGAFAHARSARHDPDAGAGAGLLERHRVLVVERQAGAQVHDVAVPEAEQDSLLHPGVHAPTGRLGGVGLGRAHFANVERLPQPRERFARFAFVCRGTGREQLLDGLSQTVPSSRNTARMRSCDACRGGTIGSRYTSSHKPIRAAAHFTGPGFDSTKFTSSSGNSR